MPDGVYELLALAARHWFVLLGAVIVLRAYLWLHRDRAEKHRRLRQLPDAGMIGEFLVLRGSAELPRQATLPVPREGFLGTLRTADVLVPAAGVAPQHCELLFRSGVGLWVIPRRGQTVRVDGREIRREADAKAHPALHGSVLEVGEAVLRLRAFVGVDIPHVSPPTQPEPPLPPSVWPETQAAPAPYQVGVPPEAPPAGDGVTTLHPADGAPYVPPPYTAEDRAGSDAPEDELAARRRQRREAQDGEDS